jgi:acyl transferase domain-containing protein/acyl carrier protein
MSLSQSASRQPQPVAIVGVGAIMPEAPTAAAFWANIAGGRYSITDLPKDRWDQDLYYDPDPRAPDKTYSRIGGWVREFAWDPIAWRLPVPPKVAEQMDDGQKWAVSAARAALIDAGWPGWGLDSERVAVVIGNAIGGEKHYATNLRIQLPEFTRELVRSPAFGALPASARQLIVEQTAQSFLSQFPEINEDTMPGELANVTAGRIANLFNFRGPGFTTDAACASALAALSAAAEGLIDGQYDAVVTGGVDRNMNVAAFVKFCKIGALSATGTRPFDAGADGFVMGEGAALFVLKRLADAERDGDRIYAVLLGVGGSSDGKGKGITAPNPIGQRLAVERAWRNACADPATVSLVEAHGTSTRVGDAAELDSLTAVFGGAGVAPGSIALGSVKSNVGHLKAAAGAAGLLKLILSLHEKALPPSLNFREPNPNTDWAAAPFRVNTELREWPVPPSGVRRGGISAFGFGGTNFHAVLEEYVPGRFDVARPPLSAAADLGATKGGGNPQPDLRVTTGGGNTQPGLRAAAGADIPVAMDGGGPVIAAVKAPLRGALVLGGATEADLVAQLAQVRDQAASGTAPPPQPQPPDPALAQANVRAAIDYGGAAELADKAALAVKALTSKTGEMRKMLRARGIFLGRGAAPKVAFLYTGQGSQYVNMLAGLRATEPIVAQTFAEADQVMTPLLGKPLTDYIFIDGSQPDAVAQLEQQLLQTEITQPAVLAADIALTRLLAAYGIGPDMVMGHSLGEYGALVAAGAMSFEAALEAVSARGREMASLEIPDKGAMAAVMAPLEEIERVVAAIDGYVVTANVNSNHQAVIGGATAAVEQAISKFQEDGRTAMRIPVSHAFHTSIVAPASEPLRRMLARLQLHAPTLPIVANVSGEFYLAEGPDVTGRMLDVLAAQVASPVQFVKGLNTLYDAGARLFVEVGPKRALQGFAEDVLGAAHDDVVTLFTNHPKNGDVPAFNAALCGLYAAGIGYPAGGPPAPATAAPATAAPAGPVPAQPASTVPHLSVPTAPGPVMSDDRYSELGHLLADLLDQGRRIQDNADWSAHAARTAPPESGDLPVTMEPVVITGAALGLPGVDRVFDDENIARILSGQQFIDVIPRQMRREMVDKHITRLVKSDHADPVFETIAGDADVIKLAGRYAPFDAVHEFGLDPGRDVALDPCSRLAIGAGIDALRDAGIPLVRKYNTTTLGTQLPGAWQLPDDLRDDTGVVFASAFPGYESFAREINSYQEDRARRHEFATLEDVRGRMNASDPAVAEVDRRIAALRHALETRPFAFDRRFLFRVLAMGHSQFAELIGARGPNTQVNSACSSTAIAMSVAEDWIKAGRCRRVIVVSADDAASDALLPWVGSGFLASGAAATDDLVEDAALPFDRRRHGMIIGSGAAALVVESAAAARERGITPICEVLALVTANSAFHGTRLDIEHIGQVMEKLVRQAERRGIDRRAIAGQTVFVSHETYTPARGGSASAEVNALRRTFGNDADSIVITNTKGFTGHAMGAGIEEVVAVKTLETGVVPPVANFRDIDPELGALNLSRGGAYPVTYALRLSAGFGSQIAMMLLRWTAPPDGQRRAPTDLGFAHRIADDAAWRSWLARVSGHPDARLEVVQRRLRVVDDGPSQPAVAPDEPAAMPAAVLTLVPASSPVTPVPITPAPPAIAPAVLAAAVLAATAPVPAATAPVPAAPAPFSADPAAQAVLDIVEDLTGYSRDLLEPDLDLEADLGVDTVKQAEVFAAVRERFGIPREENLRLRDFPTLAHVIGFVRDRAPGADVSSADARPPARPGTVQPGTVQPAAEPAVAEAPDDAVTGQIVQIVSDMTGYPPELLDLDLDLEADLGVDTVKQAEVFAAVRERFGIPREENLRLRDFPTLAHVIGFARDRGRHAEPAPVAAAPRHPVKPPPAEPAGAAQADAVQPVAAPAEPVQAGTEHAGTEQAGDAFTGQIVQIVTDMTGYPPELLDLDLDLEADLGVDTVKQAEVLAAVRERFGIPREENLRLRDFPTLAHVIGFARDRAPATAPGSPRLPGEETEEPAPTSSRTAPAFTGDISAAQRLPRRIPVPVLRPPIDWCAATAVTLDDTRRLVVMADAGGVADALIRRLDALGITALVLEAGSTAADIDARLTTWLAAGPVHGLYWLAALDAEPPIGELDLASWRDAVAIRVKNLHAVVRRLDAGGHLGPRGTFLVAATRLGGYHGYDDAGAVAPLGGAVTGFVKAYRRERADVLAKAVDFPVSRKTAAIADALIEETRRDPGAIEIGRADGRRWAVGLREVPFGDGADGLTLDTQTVFVVTGAAGSIVSAIVADLATASGGTFHLLDMTPEPDPADADLAQFATNRDGLKAAISDRLRDSGQRPTPVLVERELSRYERLHSALTAIQAVRAAGGEAHYHAVDLIDADAVGRVVADIRDRHGRIDVLLHAAGLDISHGIADKDRREYDLVFDVKSDGWFNLLHAAADLPIGATVAFSSVAGRFGNAGQTDYSAANDLLCKITSSFRRTRPGTRGIALDWTAWGGLGMATRGSVPKVMAMAGIEMLPAEAGIAWIRRELTAGPFRGEVVVGGKLGLMVGELDSAGGLDVAAVGTGGAGPMAGSVTGMGVYSGLTVETTLDPAVQPFLHDHRIDSIPVLPGVMGAEAFAATALLAAGDLHVCAIERMEFLAPVKFYRDEPRTLTVRAVIRRDGDDLVADCVLVGSRLLKGDEAPQWTTHFTGSVRLTAHAPEPETDETPRKEAAVRAGHADIYRVYFHGPAYQVLEAAWRYDGGAIGRLAAHLPPGHKPETDPTATEPRLVELCFQTAGLWEIGQTGRLALPARADLIRILRRPAGDEPLFAVVHPASDGSFDCRVVDCAGDVLVRVDGYRTVPLPGTISGDLQGPVRAAMRGEAVRPQAGEPA